MITHDLEHCSIHELTTQELYPNGEDPLKYPNHEPSAIGYPDDLEAGDEWRFGRYEDKPAEVVKAIIQGNPHADLLGKAEKVLTSAPMGKGQTMRRRRRKNEFDGEIDIDAYMSGDAAYYRKVNRVSSKARVVNVMLNIGANAAWEESELEKAYIKIFQNIYTMLKQGYLLRVSVLMPSKGGFEKMPKGNNWILINMKEGDKPADFARLITACYIGFFRSTMFRAMNYIAQKNETETTWDLGQPLSYDQNEGELLDCMKDFKSLKQEDFMYFDVVKTDGIKASEIK